MGTEIRYELLRELGRGGMAVVYEGRAHMGGIERRVAIKKITPHFEASEGARSMFLDEVRILCLLSHENIVQMLDFGSLPGGEFLVMEFVDGIDAWKAIRDGRMLSRPPSIAVALHIISEVAHALSFAHRARGPDGMPLGIVHRDVSPQNVLLSWTGGVKLSDFGIALAHDRSTRTTAGMVKGKLKYMSPEQALGTRCDAASDVFALGATLHALMTGRPPDVDLADSVKRGHALIDDSIPGDVRSLMEHALSFLPDTRPTAEDFAEEASALARGRLKRAGRTELRDWLASLKQPAGAPAILDNLILGAIEPLDQSARVYTLVETTDRTSSRTGVGSKDTAQAIDRPTWQRWVLIAAGLAAIGTVGSLLWLGALPLGAENTSQPAQNTALDAGLSHDASLRTASTTMLEDASVHDIPGATRAPADAPSRSTRDVRAPRPSSPSATAIGFVRVAGAVAFNGCVRIDNVVQYRRTATGSEPLRPPATFSVPIGTRTIEVLDPSCSHVVSRTQVQVGAENTRTNPVSVR